MSASLESLRATGTKLWLDSIDPELIVKNREWGATGATSNPIIVAGLIKSGKFDSDLEELLATGEDDETIAWTMTDRLVRQAEAAFESVFQETAGNDGYVSFELDPLLEDPGRGPAHSRRVERYVELGQRWSVERPNRMIKIPATPAGLEAIEPLVAAGVTLNVTLIFTQRQYHAAREAAWRGARSRTSLDHFKSVYSIFVSRVDVYTEEHCSELSPAAQGQVGIVNAKRIWADNQRYWEDKGTPLEQEIIFASTGVKKPEDPPEKYVAAFAGGDIQTNPPATNDAIASSTLVFSPRLASLPSPSVLDEIDQKVDFQRLEETLMEEGIRKFADPQLALLGLIAEKRSALASP